MYIVQHRSNLDPDFCHHLVQKFKTDDRKTQGITASGIDLTVKQSMDLNISLLPEYSTESQILYDALSPRVTEYIDEKMIPSGCVIKNVTGSGFQIQETKPKGFYDWHHDALIEESTYKRIRQFTYIWYLNNVEQGGETEFITGEIIRPETGKLLLFPATWTFGHRGNPPKEVNKYICTGWIYTDIEALG